MNSHSVCITQKPSLTLPTNLLPKYSVDFIEPSPDKKLLYLLQSPDKCSKHTYIMVFQANPLKFLSKKCKILKLN